MKQRISFTSIYYTIFEGLSKGGNQVLLLIIASFISSELYVKIMLLISLEALITMLYMSYYSDVVYSLKYNKSRKGLIASVNISIWQLLLFFIVYLIFKKQIDNYYTINLILLLPILLANGLISNIIRFISVIFQMELDHKKAIIYKSVPFFMSFIFSLLFFILSQDKVLGFFIGKFIGLLLFLIYIISNNNMPINSLILNRLHFGMMLKRVKYSFLIALLGWASGLGFLNFVKIYSTDQTQIVYLGVILNIFTVLLLFANGINQVYTPKLKQLIMNNLISAYNYSKKIHLLYTSVTIFFFIISICIILFKHYIIFYVPQVTDVINLHLFTIIILFFSYQFYAISYPYLMILDRYKQYFSIIFLWNLLAWISIFISVIYFQYKNFIVYYCFLKIVEWVIIYTYVLHSVKKRIYE